MVAHDQQREMYDRLAAAVRQVLIEWDPIGVLSDPDWPDDEYDTYVPAICSALINFDDICVVETKLNSIVEMNMGMGQQRIRNKDFAQKLWKLKETIVSQHN